MSLSEIQQVLSGILIVLGAGFCLSAAVGILRFPNLYTRIHAGTKGLAAGGLLILLGVILQQWSATVTLKLSLTTLFFLLTNPISSHAIARAAYNENLVPIRQEQVEHPGE